MRAEPMTLFSSQYGETYPDNLWVFTPPVSPTLTPQLPPPPPTKKILWLSTIKPGNDRAARTTRSKETEESSLFHGSSKNTVKNK